MPIRIPQDKRVAAEYRLTSIRLIGTLADAAKVTKDRVKASMISRGVQYAQSDYVIGMLRDGGSSGAVDPHKAWELVERKKLTLDQFLACVTVNKTPLKDHLCGADIESISAKAKGKPEPTLLTEWKPNVKFELDGDLDDALAQVVEQVVRSEA